jgi:hypothetical protein
MRIREYLRLYLRSAFGLGSLLVALLVGFLPGRVLPGLGLGLAVFAALFLLGLVTGLGSRAAFAESGREAAQRAAAGLAAMADDRARLAALRLGDEELAKARDLVVLQAGRVIDGAARRKAELPGWDPAAGAALREAIEALDSWLREADETALERRFGTEDAHPFPEAAARVAGLLRDKAAVLAKSVEELSGSPLPSETIAIQEEQR